MSARIIRKGNMTIIVYGDYRVCGYSYDTLILGLWYAGERSTAYSEYFNAGFYSTTTTHHQGYLSDIFVRVTTAKNPREEIAKINADNLHYMSIAERKYWNLKYRRGEAERFKNC